jgi:hypothetical protein
MDSSEISDKLDGMKDWSFKDVLFRNGWDSAIREIETRLLGKHEGHDCPYCICEQFGDYPPSVRKHDHQWHADEDKRGAEVCSGCMEWRWTNA